MLAIDGLGIGGADMVVRDLAYSLNRQWFDVSVCCTLGLGPIGEQLVADGIDAFVVPGRHQDRVDYLTPLKFRRAVQERHIDIVHSHATAALLDTAACKLTMPGLKIVHTFHYGNYPYESWRHHLMEGLSSRVVDRLIAVGFEQRRRLQECYRLPESRIGTVWNGLKLEPSAPDTSFRSHLQTGDRLLVGTIAKLIEQKGLDDLMKVARRCRDAGLKMQFVIVGDGPLRSALEQQRRDLGLDDGSVVITGWIQNAATRVLPTFDIFFQPSRWEAMSIAILEAMANAKPIVATTVGDNAHVLADGVTGLLVESGNVTAMVDALTRTAEPALRQALGTAARARFADKFTLEHMVHAYEDVYRQLAGLAPGAMNR
jgi:glycosyltransferase involved in cell wall biosynthesis